MNAPLIQTSEGLTPEQIVDYLTFCSYRHNRQTMSAADLATLFPTTGAAMETRFWADKAKEYAKEDDYERKTYCGCDKGELTAEERATHRCQRCGKEI